jgi:hypothetical protein
LLSILRSLSQHKDATISVFTLIFYKFKMVFRSSLVVALLLCGADAFSMKMSSNGDSRRAFLNRVAATSAAVVAGGLSGGMISPSPVLAVGGGKKVDALLSR